MIGVAAVDRGQNQQAEFNKPFPLHKVKQKKAPAR
jgi:hypothetical protein